MRPWMYLCIFKSKLSHDYLWNLRKSPSFQALISSMWNEAKGRRIMHGWCSLWGGLSHRLLAWLHALGFFPLGLSFLSCEMSILIATDQELLWSSVMFIKQRGCLLKTKTLYFPYSRDGWHYYRRSHQQGLNSYSPTFWYFSSLCSFPVVKFLSYFHLPKNKP